MIIDAIRQPRHTPRAALGASENDVLVRALVANKSTAGISVNESNALSFSALWAALRIVAQTLGMVSWHVMERRDGGKFIATEHDVDFLLSTEPNQDMSSLSWREAMACCAMLWGNSYAEIGRAASGIVSIGVPIHPSRVKPDRKSGGRLVYIVKPDRAAGETKDRTIAAADMFHLKGFGGNGLMGYVMLDVAKETIGHSLAVERFGSSWFGNGAHAGGFIKHPGQLDKQARKRVRETLQQVHGDNPDNWNKLAVLDEGMEWIMTSVSPEQSQFLQTRVFNIAEASRLTGVPPHLLAELSRATFSNIEHMSISFVRYGLLAWAKRLETEGDRKLFERPAESAFFTKMNLKTLIRGDTKTQGEFYRIMRRLGAFSVNDILELEDRNPIGPEGDIRVVERNMMALKELLSPEPVGGSGSSTATAEGEGVENYKASSAIVFEDIAQRLVAIECERVTKAAKKYKTDCQAFNDWCDKFYDTHAQHTTQLLQAPVASLTKLVCDGSEAKADLINKLARDATDSYISAYIETARDEAKEAFRTKSIEDLCGLWRIHRSADLSREMTDCVADAVLEYTGEVLNEANGN